MIQSPIRNSFDAREALGGSTEEGGSPFKIIGSISVLSSSILAEVATDAILCRGERQQQGIDRLQPWA